jgi:hypothetical protein
VKILCDTDKLVSGTIISQLMPCIAGGPGSVFLSARLSLHLDEFVFLMQKAQVFFQFNAENPSGHYKLDLERPACYAIAEALMLLDGWETGIAVKHGREDTSQRHNRSQVRNETFGGTPLMTSAFAEWTLPNSDMLELDYCSLKRAPADALEVPKVTLANMLVSLQESEIPDVMMVEALRKVSHHVYLTALQLRDILALFKDKKLMCDVCVIFVNRVVDMWNEKVFRVRFENPGDLVLLCKKMGFCTAFPFIQPEQLELSFDFQYHDQRLACNRLIQLANKERRENVFDFDMTDAAGAVDSLPLGLPRSWDVFEKMPKGGVFKAHYRCAPEDRNLMLRGQNLSHLGGWTLDSSKHEVMWWADVHQAPRDVILLLCFLASRFNNIESAFKFISAGMSDTSCFNLRKFEDGVRGMGCKKFKGESEAERLKVIFRYMDASGEGFVSAREFDVLTLLWNEIVLCIKDFVAFLERTVGDDLDEIWDFFDEDKNDEIDEDEWSRIVNQIGYFGLVMPIFYFLDKDGEGTISADEFGALGKYMAEVASP